MTFINFDKLSDEEQALIGNLSNQEKFGVGFLLGALETLNVTHRIDMEDLKEICGICIKLIETWQKELN